MIENGGICLFSSQSFFILFSVKQNEKEQQQEQIANLNCLFFPTSLFAHTFSFHRPADFTRLFFTTCMCTCEEFWPEKMRIIRNNNL